MNPDPLLSGPCPPGGGSYSQNFPPLSVVAIGACAITGVAALSARLAAAHRSAARWTRRTRQGRPHDWSPRGLHPAERGRRDPDFLM